MRYRIQGWRQWKRHGLSVCFGHGRGRHAQRHFIPLDHSVLIINGQRKQYSVHQRFWQHLCGANTEPYFLRHPHFNAMRLSFSVGLSSPFRFTNNVPLRVWHACCHTNAPVLYMPHAHLLHHNICHWVWVRISHG